MVSETLVGFMRREFGLKCLKLLNDTHMTLGIDDVEYADDDIKKRFILELQPLFKEKSLSRSEVLISEMMSILKINPNIESYVDQSLTHANLEIIKEYVRLQGENKIKVAYAQTEALINLYMKNTNKALHKGISKDKIHNMTERGLVGLRSALLEIANKIDGEYNLKTSVQIMENKIKEAQETGEPIDTSVYEKQVSMSYAVIGYKKRIEKLYGEYRKLFMTNIDRKVKAEKEGKRTEHVNTYLRIVSKDIFSRVEKTFSQFQKQIIDS